MCDRFPCITLCTIHSLHNDPLSAQYTLCTMTLITLTRLRSLLENLSMNIYYNHQELRSRHTELTLELVPSLLGRGPIHLPGILWMIHVGVSRVWWWMSWEWHTYYPRHPLVKRHTYTSKKTHVLTHVLPKNTSWTSRNLFASVHTPQPAPGLTPEKNKMKKNTSGFPMNFQESDQDLTWIQGST